MGATRPPTPKRHGGGNTVRGGAYFGGAGPGAKAQTSARRSGQHRQIAGGGRRRTSPWEPFGSACSPALGGRPDRVRGDARAGLLGELEASVDPRPLTRHPPPSPSLPGLTPFSSDRVSHKRYKRLLAN